MIVQSDLYNELFYTSEQLQRVMRTSKHPTEDDQKKLKRVCVKKIILGFPPLEIPKKHADQNAMRF